MNNDGACACCVSHGHDSQDGLCRTVSVHIVHLEDEPYLLLVTGTVAESSEEASKVQKIDAFKLTHLQPRRQAGGGTRTSIWCLVRSAHQAAACEGPGQRPWWDAQGQRHSLVQCMNERSWCGCKEPHCSTEQTRALPLTNQALRQWVDGQLRDTHELLRADVTFAAAIKRSKALVERLHLWLAPCAYRRHTDTFLCAYWLFADVWAALSIPWQQPYMRHCRCL